MTSLEQSISRSTPKIEASLSIRFLKLVKSGTTTHKEVRGARFPHFLNNTSCLPMLAEFCIRTNNAAALFACLQDIRWATTGIAIMLMQLEETIALKRGKKYLEHLKLVNEEANPELLRIALKLATGAGKVWGPIRNFPHLGY